MIERKVESNGFRFNVFSIQHSMQINWTNKIQSLFHEKIFNHFTRKPESEWNSVEFSCQAKLTHHFLIDSFAEK